MLLDEIIVFLYNKHMKTQDLKLDILGLTKVEKAVFAMLSFESSFSVSDIAKKAKIPRTSALPALERLRDRKLSRKTNIGKRTFWKKVKKENLKKELDNLSLSIGIEDELEKIKKVVDIKVSKKEELMIIRGFENILEFQENIISQTSLERIYLIQGSEIAEEVKKRNFLGGFIKLNKLVKEKGIITELIASENTLGIYKKLMKEDEFWRESVSERLLDMHAIENTSLENNVSEIAIYKDMALITNWKEETMVVIKNKDTVMLFKNLFTALKFTGRKINPNEFFK